MSWGGQRGTVAQAAWHAPALPAASTMQPRLCQITCLLPSCKAAPANPWLPPPPTCLRVVEVGCGSGYVLASAALALHAACASNGTGCQLLATDVNPQALAAAARTLAAHNVRCGGRRDIIHGA